MKLPRVLVRPKGTQVHKDLKRKSKAVRGQKHKKEAS